MLRRSRLSSAQLYLAITAGSFTIQAGSWMIQCLDDPGTQQVLHGEHSDYRGTEFSLRQLNSEVYIILE